MRDRTEFMVYVNVRSASNQEIFTLFSFFPSPSSHFALTSMRARAFFHRVIYDLSIECLQPF